MRRLTVIFPVSVFFITLIICKGVFANGYKILGVKDAKASAMGEAFIVQADNPSAIAFNPAGLIQLEGTQLSLETTLTNGWPKRTSPDGSTKEDGMDRWQTVPGLFLTSRLNDDLAVGLGITTPNGLSSEWHRQSFARYVATFSEIILVDVNPSFAFKVNDNLSLGAGVSYYYSTVDLYSMVDYGTLLSSPGSADGETRLEGKGHSFGYNFGMLYNLNEKHGFAATFKSAVNVKYYGDAKYFNYMGTGTRIDTDVESSINFPAVVVLGYAYRPTERLKLEFNLDWTDWSILKDIIIDQDNASLGSVTYNYQYQDTFAYKLGLEYEVSDLLKLRMGYIYNECAVPEQNWGPGLPDTEHHFLCFGFGYEPLKDKITIDGALQLIFYESRTIDNNVNNNETTTCSSVDGYYENFAVAFSVGVTYRF